MPRGVTPISKHLRARKSDIAKTWETLVRAEVPRLAGLDRTSLLDHLPEFLEALARWTEGDTAGARAGFTALAEGHALQRLGYGIDLIALVREYTLLRSTIMRELMAVGTAEQTRELILRLNDGMDAAMLEAVRYYTQAHPGIRSVLAPTDMGEVAREVAAEHQVQVAASGDLLGVWDRDAVRAVLAALIDDVTAITLRESGDRQAIILTLTRDQPTVPQMTDRIRDLALSHGARFTMQDNRFAIEWPRTPLRDVPQRT